MVTNTILLGLTVGLIAILPPGPVALSLIEVGVHQGRRGGALGAIGIAGGDVVVASLAAIVVVVGGALPAAFFSGMQLVSGLILIVLGALLLGKPAVTEGLARSIRHPGRTFFAITALTPTVFGAWVAMIAALPFAADGRAVAGFVIGAMIASLAYHLMLGTGAGDLGHRIRPEVMRALSRIGGVCMAAFGVWTLL